MRQRAVVAAPIFAVAIIGLCSLPGSHSFTVPSLPGVTTFTGSAAPVNTVGSAKLQALADQRSRLQARDGLSGMAMKAVRNPQLIGTPIPRKWTEGTDFIRDGRGIGTGDLVIIVRSDGRCGVVGLFVAVICPPQSKGCFCQPSLSVSFCARSHALSTLCPLLCKPHHVVIYVSAPVQ